jgi:AcrR family transcriptional regulator
MPAVSPRERILQAASQCFSEFGFRGVRAEAVAKRAKVNPVTVYRLFGNKQTLFEATYEYLHERLNAKELLVQALKHPTIPYEAFAGSVLYIMSANLLFSRVSVWAMLENPKEGRKFIIETVIPARQALAEFIRNDPKVSSKVNPVDASNLLLGAIVNYFHFREVYGGKKLKWFYESDPSKKFVEVWLHGIYNL